jgi:hypothetical protein
MPVVPCHVGFLSGRLALFATLRSLPEAGGSILNYAETASEQPEVDTETIQDWKTLRRNLAFTNAALSIANARRFIDEDMRSIDASVSP